ncbi:MAG: class I SAM-dependent methyltransferase [Candidatus Bathyarchaeia archaeon]|jgi:ubiquinone/menaquinone biosynthesis C-methylase UbiE
MGAKQENPDVEHFNRRAATYETASSQGYFFDRIQRRILKLAKTQNPQVILDVGCGTGRLLRKAKQQWPDAHLVGVDAAEKMIQQATELFPEAEFHVAMAEALPLPDASVDLAFSTMSFHHWANQAQGIREVARVLRPQGRFALADIVVPRWMMFFVRHFKYNSPAKIREMFVQAGLPVELQQKPWRWSRVLLITVGRKP